MRFRNIRLEYQEYFNEYFGLHSSIPSGKKRTEREKASFAEKWRSGEAGIRDWIYAQSDEVKVAEDGLSREQLAMVNEHRKKLYDLWLEIKVQDRFATRLKEVIKYAPDAIKPFCKEELQQLQHSIEEPQEGHQRTNYLQEMLLESISGFRAIFAEVVSADYQSPEDLHAAKGVPEAEALARYKKYLEKFIEEGLEEEPYPVPDPDEISLELMWPHLIRLAKELTVRYRSHTHHFKEDSYIDYEVVSVSGCSEWSLRKRMDQMFENGFNTLLSKLGPMHKDDQQDVIIDLIDQIKALIAFTTDGEYIVEESEHEPRREHRFKKFRYLRYQGDSDLQFAHSMDNRAFMDRKLVGYVEVWINGVHAMERKLEHLLNNLNLVNSLSVTFDVKSIFENVFIIESEEIAQQGTVFYLRDIGIITCDHCLRDEDGTLCSDAVIYKHDKIGDKVPVKIVKSDKDYDLAILELEIEQPGFLGPGLQMGNSDELERTDMIGVAGFPNYNFGDSGNFTNGSVSMFRTISGIRHIFVTNPLVEGNSGGPGFNRMGQVVGVVTTGSTTFANASNTEKHGLTPIEHIDRLLK